MSSMVVKGVGLGALFAGISAISNQDLPKVTIPESQAVCQVKLEEPLGIKSAVIIDSKGKTLYKFGQGTDVFGPKYTGEGMAPTDIQGVFTTVGAFSVGVKNDENGQPQAKTCTVDGQTFKSRAYAGLALN